MMTELIEDCLLVSSRVLQQWYAIWPVSNPTEFPAEVAAVFATLVFVQQETILF